jgi:starch synthase
MRILFVSSECVPFASTGGLGDVSASLPKALAAAGFDVIRVLPYYRQVREGKHGVQPMPLSLEIPMGRSVLRAEFATLKRDGVTNYFVVRDEFFDRTHLYSLPHRAYEDNFERYLFFQKAVVGLVDALGLKPDIVHGNDWQTGLLPAFFRHGIHGHRRAGEERTVFTIHNLAYQGVFPADLFPMTNLPASFFGMQGLEFYGQMNCLKAALYTSDAITTVSRTYANEIQTPAFGCGLEGVIRERTSVLRGIVNGIDYDEWNPSNDPHLASKYDADTLPLKRLCRAKLLEECGFPSDTKKPLIGMISRMTEQKGFDLLRSALPGLMDRDLHFVFLGSGEARYQDLCLQWQETWPDKVKTILKFDPALAHRIEAGADAFLMPSRYEPCGLNQLYSLRYGTLPIVSNTGGLADTVEGVDEKTVQTKGTGFKMDEYSPKGLSEQINLMIRTFAKPDVWMAVQKRAMAKDFSWSVTANEYMAMYRELVPES